LFTGGSDEFIRGYRTKAKGGEAPSVGDEEEVLEYIGCVARNTTGANDKCVSLSLTTFHNSPSIPMLLASQSSGKLIEVD
jgi:hypothetical protein